MFAAKIEQIVSHVFPLKKCAELKILRIFERKYFDPRVIMQFPRFSFLEIDAFEMRIFNIRFYVLEVDQLTDAVNGQSGQTPCSHTAMASYAAFLVPATEYIVCQSKISTSI